MITYVVGSLFQSPARVLVNAVNTVGVMGKGIALQFRQFYPEMYEQYRVLCKRDQFHVGQLWLYRTPHKWILNFPTKHHWRDGSRLEDIEAGLRKFTAVYAEQGITSASFPLLGSGLGGLDWQTQVRPLMEQYLDPLPINVFVHLYEPANPFADRDPPPASLSAWLNGEPDGIGFNGFWNDFLKLVGRGQNLETYEDQAVFHVSFRAEEERFVFSEGEQVVVQLTESMMADLWHSITAAGYLWPQNMPSGLDAHGSLIVTALARLPYVRPVLLDRGDGVRSVGLHYVPPSTSLVYRPAAQVKHI